jgi:pyruvate/2-oxoglutarate dehydrogenase complex dihydrolipoamide dehydrogenase (E3) component
MTWVARALETDESRGLVKATVDADSGQVLGCTAFGLEGGEIMSMVQIAMMGRLPWTALRDATFAHPALSEGLNTLFTTLES